MYCKTCKWYCEFEGVCVNADSEHCADFVDADFFCNHFCNHYRWVMKESPSCEATEQASQPLMRETVTIMINGSPVVVYKDELEKEIYEKLTGKEAV